MDRINFSAVIMAFVAEIGADLVLSTIVVAVFLQGYDISDTMTADETKAIMDQVTNSPSFLMTWFCFGTGTTVGGGYLAARLAKTFPYFNGLAIGILGLAPMIVYWNDSPVWYNVLGLLTTIPFSIYGAHLAKQHMAAMK